LGFGLVAVRPLLASGTYPFTPPHPPSSEEFLDEDRYSLGRSIFLGKTEFPQPAPLERIAENALHLVSLQTQLPESLRQDINLPALATKISEPGLAALEYYLLRRYKIAPKLEPVPAPAPHAVPLSESVTPTPPLPASTP
jgi:hypothetical protein